MITRIIYCQPKSSKENFLKVIKQDDSNNSSDDENAPLLLPRLGETVIFQRKIYQVVELVHFPVHQYSSGNSDDDEEWDDTSNVDDALSYLKEELKINLEMKEIDPHYGYRGGHPEIQIVLVVLSTKKGEKQSKLPKPS